MTAAAARVTRERAGIERGMAFVRLGAVPFLFIQLALVPPASAAVMYVVVAIFATSGSVVLGLYVRRPDILSKNPVRIAIFAADCIAFTLALVDYAGPTDLTWVTFILVLLSAVVRWDVRGAAVAVVIFAAADLPLDIATPAFTHLTFNPGSITFKLGLISLLAFFFGSQFRTFRRASGQQLEQAEAIHRQAETVMRSEGQLRVIFDTALMAFITMDEDGIVQDWNHQAEASFGWTKAEAVGRPLSETIVPPQHREAHEEGLARYRRTRTGAVLGQVIEITAVHRDGREFPVELSISPAATVDGQTTFIAFVRDVTERKRSDSLHSLQLGVTRALAEARSLEEAAPQVLGEIGTHLGLVLAQWWEVSSRQDCLTWKEAWLVHGVAAVDFINDSQALQFSKGEGLPGRVWAAAQAVVIEDVQQDEAFPRRQQARDAGLHSAVALPILDGLEVTGVIELYSTAAGSFDDAVLRVLGSVGSQVGQFLQRRRAEAGLRATGERITAVLENVADGIVTVDELGCLQSLNAAARALFGYRSQEVVGRPVETLVDDGDRQKLIERLPLSPEGRSHPGALEVSGRRMDGSIFPMEVHASEMNLAGQRVNIISLRDISERRAQTDALQYQALHDALTGLPNRTLLGDRLRHSVAAATRGHSPLALLVLDLDRFKEVNDTMGHAQGDLLLQQVASRIRELLRESDTVSRLGGDEFAILPSGATGKEGATRTAQKVARAFDSPFIIDDRAFDIRPSIGIALFPDHGQDAEALMRSADVAMYVAKRGKKSYEVYDASQDEDTALRLALINELRHAADRDELLLHFQPKVDLRTDRVTSVEALLRWINPGRGTLSPDQFIAFAEQTEIINSITRWVLNAALHQQRKWLDTGIELAMAVNMSARNLHDPGLPDLVGRLLATWNIPAEMLIVEITEGVAMDAAAEERLQQLGGMGVRLSIDDFGTGYSSLAYLKRLPMDELKIDRSFVSGMDANPDDAAIVRPTIDLGHNLGLQVVAEGVESEVTLQMLRAYGCDVAQGHHISAPLGAADLTIWLAAHQGHAGRPLRAPSLRAVEGTQA
ncbi:MAG: hypothetical protein NVSMB17_17450 [Candidatus Dormibacteria bacterium]